MSTPRQKSGYHGVAMLSVHNAGVPFLAWHDFDLYENCPRVSATLAATLDAPTRREDDAKAGNYRDNTCDGGNRHIVLFFWTNLKRAHIQDLFRLCELHVLDYKACNSQDHENNTDQH
jgi:hypothetical protein